MKQVIRYQCSHCRKVSTSKAAILKHEKTCPGNEENKACKTCLFFTHGNVPSCYGGKLSQPTPGNQFGLRIDCDNWTSKEL